MGKYLSNEGMEHFINKLKENFVSATEPINATYATNAGYADTTNSAAKSNQATTDAAGNVIHSTYLTQLDAANIYLKKGDNAVTSTKSVTAETCTGNAENATRLSSKRKFNIEDATGLNSGTKIEFDGTADVKLKLPATIKATLDGNASTSTRATSDGAGNIIANYYAPNHNPVFTGTPQAPTANTGTNNNQISTTAFVQNEINQALENNISEFMRTLLDDSDAETARQTLNALGKNEKAASSTVADFSTKAEKDSAGNIITSTYAPILNAELKGTPQAPTAESHVADNQIATTKFVATAIQNLIGNSPAQLNTLFELAAAVNNDENFANTIAQALSNKQNLSDALTSISNLNTSADKIIFTTAENVYDVTTLTPFMRTLLDDSDAETARQTLNALGKDEKAVNSTTADKADFATTAEKDSDGNIISEKYLPKVETVEITIPLDDWTEDWDDFFYDFNVENLTANDIVNINLAPESHTKGILCGLCPTVEIFDGYFRLRAKEIPIAEIFGEYYILKGASIGKSKTLGNVNTSTSQRVIIYQVPEQVDNLTYNGNVQVPTWDDYDPTKLLMTGEISGIDAKTYTLKFTPIGNCTWTDDSRTPRTKTWQINRAVTKIPSQIGTLTFNGNPQNPILENFNENEIVLSGNFENLIDAGIYTAYATPTSNFMFDDNSTDAKSFTVTVEKAAQIISLDKNSLSLENILMSDTVIVNRLGDGIISATSSDENIVTVENVDGEITVTAISTGNATVSIHVAESKNYLAAEINLPVESFVIKPLEECTPAEILDAVKSGKATNAWDVGDFTAPIILNGKIGDALTFDNFEVRAMLIGLNHNVEIESDGENSAHFILKAALVDSNYNNASASGAKYFQHNTTLSSNVGGWTLSNLRQNICTDIYNALPDDWKSVIAPCSKFTEEQTDDEIFLLSEFEVFGKISYSNSTEQNFQSQYEYFRNGNSKIFENNDSACHWWLRSAQNSNDTSFCRVNPNGTVGTYNARYSLGIVPAFMVR